MYLRKKKWQVCFLSWFTLANYIGLPKFVLWDLRISWQWYIRQLHRLTQIANKLFECVWSFLGVRALKGLVLLKGFKLSSLYCFNYRRSIKIFGDFFYKQIKKARNFFIWLSFLNIEKYVQWTHQSKIWIFHYFFYPYFLSNGFYTLNVPYFFWVERFMLRA